jgi:guanylate cyclase
VQILQGILARIARSVSRIGFDPNDTEEMRLKKSVGIGGMLFGGFPTWIIWIILLFAFGEVQVAWIQVGWFSLMIVLLFLLIVQPRIYPFNQFIVLLSFLIAPLILSVLLGGITNSGMILLWGLITPLYALVLSSPRSALGWFIAYAALVIASAIVDPYIRAPNHLPQVLVTFLQINNILIMSGIAFFALYYFMRQRDEAFRLLRIEQAKSESLLLNILPADIAARLKRGEDTIADQHESVTILFMDIVNFTPLSASASPKAMVDLLSRMFSQFDQWVDEYGVQKIETIGDSYMVAAGLSHPRTDHAQAVMRLALDIRSYFELGIFLDGQRLTCRVGINSGPVTAGVIERKKIAYHVWGDTVNTASRMESHGVPGQIQISESTYELIKDDFICEQRGAIPVKGKGEMPVWLVKGLRIGNHPTRRP